MEDLMRHSPSALLLFLAPCTLAACILGSCASGPRTKTPAAFEARLAAASSQGIEGIPLMLPLLQSSDGAAKRGAIRAIRKLAYATTRDGNKVEEERAAKAILALAGSELPEPTRAELIRLLAVCQGDVQTQRALEGLATADKGLAEAATYALEARFPRGPEAHQFPGKIAALDRELHRLEALAEEKGYGAALEGYRALLRSELPQAWAAALRVLSRMDAPGLYSAYLSAAGSGDISLSRIGIRGLASLRDPSTTPRLVASYRDASRRARNGLLEALALRADRQARDFLLTESQQKEADLRNQALRLLGNFDQEDVRSRLVASLSSKDSSERSAAALSLARIGGRLMDASSAGSDKARGLAHAILNRCEGKKELSAALALCDRHPATDSIHLMRPLLKRKTVREDAAKSLLLACRGLTDKKEKIQLLTEIFEASRSRTHRRRACDGLRELGVDTSAFARKSGFLIEWDVLGCFPKANAEDLGSWPFASEGPNTKQGFAWKGKELAWRHIVSKDPDGLVDLLVLPQKNNAVAYSVTELAWPREEELSLLVGSDDAVAIWCNGVRVHKNFVARGVSIDEDKVKVHLRKGKNRIVVKVSQGGGDWGFCVRLAKKDGTPYSLVGARSKS